MKNYAVATVFSTYETPAGFGALLADDAGLVAHHLPFGAATAREALELVATLHPLAKGESPLTLMGARLLASYFAGERVVFDLPLQIGAFTEFRQQVFRMVSSIPYGKAMSYAEVAAACACPKGARAIGGAMAANPLPIIIPCHRVVGTSGLLTGFTAPGGVASKRELLLMEGAVFAAAGGLFPAVSLRL